MKLKWKLWQIVVAWFALHLIGILSFVLGWVFPLTLVGAIIVHIAWGAFAQSVGYGILVGEKALQEWKKQIKETSGPIQPNASTSRSRARDFVIWILLPIIIYITFDVIAFWER